MTFDDFHVNKISIVIVSTDFASFEVCSTCILCTFYFALLPIFGETLSIAIFYCYCTSVDEIVYPVLSLYRFCGHFGDFFYHFIIFGGNYPQTSSRGLSHADLRSFIMTVLEDDRMVRTSHRGF